MQLTFPVDGNAAAASSRQKVLRLGILLGGCLLWWGLGRWVVSGSERFFLVVPPVILALAANHPPMRSLLGKRRIVVLLCSGAILATLCVAYNLTLTAPLFPAEGGWWRGLSMEEVAITMYFLLALYLIVTAIRHVVRPVLIRFLVPMTTSRRLVPAIVAEGILLAGFAPLFLSTFHVHRFKVPNPERPASLADRPFENVQFTTEDNLVLRGWFIPAEQPSERTLLICHGMGVNRTAVLPYLAVGDGLRANVLMFDFRGHGDSDGHTISFGRHEKQDVRAAIDFLRRRQPRQCRRLFALGISMGTAGLIGAASEVEPPFDAVILDSGFAVASDLPEELLREVPAPLRTGLAVSALPLACLDSACWLPGLRPLDDIAEIRAPVLIIHARGDRLIPPSHAHRLHDAAQVPRSLWLTDTGGHGSAITCPAEYRVRVNHFLQAHCPR